MSLSKTLYPLLSTGSTQEDWKSPDMTEKLFTKNIKYICNRDQIGGYLIKC